ncbi:MAG: alpha-L-fucosidase [Draconibacterium sp.]|nr:alpha-L-fucosidase [Draconibacterium sp.]
MIKDIFYKISRKSLPIILVAIIFSGCSEQNAEKNLTIPLPNKAQLRWQNYERTMFVCIDPATWQGREYDNHSTPLNRITPIALNTDQWCEVAKSWDAGLILFVAKHTGGFCWWQTNSTDYGIKNTPWKKGKGDVLKELSESCNKYGLDLGIYVYPGDETWGAGIGSGGITKDSTKQEGYNKVFRQQLTEVLTNYGAVSEVWFDGSCNINVNDILEKYASDAVILQGPKANLRWVGNESGYAPFSNWYTFNSKDLETGVATAIQSNPFGDVYAPVEIDVPLLKNRGHKWFWAPNTDSLLLSTEQLMDIYYKSAGRGAVLLLNSTPDTTGLIPESHVAAYKAFGNEIKRRFDSPIMKTGGKGNSLELTLSNPTEINHVILQEEIAMGQRVLGFSIEIMDGSKQWKEVFNGTSIGSKRICYFAPVTTEKIRASFTNTKAKPLIANFAVYNVKGVSLEPENRKDQSNFYDGILRKNATDQPDEPAIEIANWDSNTFSDSGWKEMSFDLTKFVQRVGQYEVTFAATDNSKEPGLEFKDWEMEMYGNKKKSTIEFLKESSTFRITRSQQTLDEFPTILRLKIKSQTPESAGNVTIRMLTY